MNIGTMNKAVDQFKSSFESPGFLEVADSELAADLTLSFNDNKQFYTYLSSVHAREPILAGSELSFIPQDVPGQDYTSSWQEFNELSYINNKYTLEFVANTLVPPPALSFIDKSQLGVSNTYKPYGSNSSRAVALHLTTDVNGASEFYLANFKYKLFRGTVTFSRHKVIPKGTIISIIDKDIKIIVIEIKMNVSTGVTSYTGIVLAKGV